MSRARKDGLPHLEWWLDWMEADLGAEPRQDNGPLDFAARRYAHRRNAEARKAARRQLPQQYPTDT